MCLIYLLFLESVWKTFTTNDPEFGIFPPSVSIVFVRFLCGLIMHLTLQPEIRSALKFMKYANNHTWKFRSWRYAYLIGFGQLLMVISVEFINLILLCENDTVMDIIMDFLALVIISDFDEYYVASLESDPNF